MPKAGRVMTQCNAGALATGGIGTALGVIRMAIENGQKIEVIVPETRPFLQGARLTAWELDQDGIPLTLITDNMVGHFLKTGSIGAVVVGADRIARNGDTANKVGTYGIAVLARENGVPFYVAAPISTLDLSIASGEQIPIEERSSGEVTHLAGVRISPDVRAAHPAFDVTPGEIHQRDPSRKMAWHARLSRNRAARRQRLCLFKHLRSLPDPTSKMQRHEKQRRSKKGYAQCYRAPFLLILGRA